MTAATHVPFRPSQGEASMSRLNVVVVMGRCSSSRSAFGVRFEEKRRAQWVADWAFPVKEAAGQREGFDRGDIQGTFTFDPTYPGCPYCKSHSVYRCECGKVA